jgi:hypothetical protein
LKHKLPPQQEKMEIDEAKVVEQMPQQLPQQQMQSAASLPPVRTKKKAESKTTRGWKEEPELFGDEPLQHWKAPVKEKNAPALEALASQSLVAPRSEAPFDPTKVSVHGLNVNPPAHQLMEQKEQEEETPPEADVAQQHQFASRALVPHGIHADDPENVSSISKYAYTPEEMAQMQELPLKHQQLPSVQEEEEDLREASVEPAASYISRASTITPQEEALGVQPMEQDLPQQIESLKKQLEGFLPTGSKRRKVEKVPFQEKIQQEEEEEFYDVPIQAPAHKKQRVERFEKQQAPPSVISEAPSSIVEAQEKGYFKEAAQMDDRELLAAYHYLVSLSQQKIPRDQKREVKQMLDAITDESQERFGAQEEEDYEVY